MEQFIILLKCPYSVRNQTPVEACSSAGFYCTADVSGYLHLKRHSYYAQVQGQMGVGGRPWCDFVVVHKERDYCREDII